MILKGAQTKALFWKKHFWKPNFSIKQQNINEIETEKTKIKSFASPSYKRTEERTYEEENSPEAKFRRRKIGIWTPKYLI